MPSRKQLKELPKLLGSDTSPSPATIPPSHQLRIEIYSGDVVDSTRQTSQTLSARLHAAATFPDTATPPHATEDPGTAFNPISARARRVAEREARLAALQREQDLVRAGISKPTPQSDMGLFGVLPGEIRNHIYQLALVKPPMERFDFVSEPGTCDIGPCVHAKLQTSVPGLLSVCRQVRHEAMPIFCAQNVFRFDPGMVRNRCAALLVKSLGSYARLIRNITLGIEVWEWDLRVSKMVLRTYRIIIEGPCRLHPGVCRSTYLVKLNRAVLEREEEACWKLLKRMTKLNSRYGNLGGDELLTNFLAGDQLAHLVYRCKK